MMIRSVNHRHCCRVLLALALCLLMTAVQGSAQEPDKRRVTPVKPETNRVQPPPKGTDEKLIQQYITGDSTAAVQEARRDSLRRVYTRYPRLTDLTVGVNIADPLFMAFGQSYASTDVNLTLNMWNRLQPTVELGLGWAKTSPDDEDFTTFKAKVAPYVKLGANYNFLFKNTPDHQVLLAARLGYTTFSYDYKGWTYADTDTTTAVQDIRGERHHALWGELGIGLKVRLFSNLSMGWMLRYHGILGQTRHDLAKPWFIPGYGPRGKSLGFSLGIYYTIPASKRE